MGYRSGIKGMNYYLHLHTVIPNCNPRGMRFKRKNPFWVKAKKRWKEFI